MKFQIQITSLDLALEAETPVYTVSTSNLAACTTSYSILLGQAMDRIKTVVCLFGKIIIFAKKKKVTLQLH